MVAFFVAWMEMVIKPLPTNYPGAGVIKSETPRIYPGSFLEQPSTDREAFPKPRRFHHRHRPVRRFPSGVAHLKLLADEKASSNAR